MITIHKNGSVTFTVTVSPARATYLKECLERPLCLGCHREEDECSADPCLDVQIDRGEVAWCKGCYGLYDPACYKDGLCPKCRGVA